MTDPDRGAGNACTRLVAVSLTALLATPAACVSSLPRAPAKPLAGHPELADGSYDWHGLLMAPFGSALKDVPSRLHEVLLFRDAERSGAATEDPECYTSDAPPPRFVGRIPEEYLLCFKQDRLIRIQASVRLPTDPAADVFAQACAMWASNAAAPSGGTCDGSDGAVHFSGRLAEEADAAESTLSVVLDVALDRQ